MRATLFILSAIFSVVFILFPVKSLGHGMSEAGPNGGEIKMPGIFHTEVFMDQNKVIRTYLLDGEIKNAVTEKSTVSAYVKRGAERMSLKCEMAKGYFACYPQANFSIKNGDKVIINANRQGQVGVAVYEFPFKYPGKRELASSK